ncbi:MAG: murein biosynthesis integral membrane protein MurJ [Deltaproteobacteria bacterium]|nr:murein biosynthesis integral membrane protein MurJ [Deltaproteobacteria bacterium]
MAPNAEKRRVGEAAGVVGFFTLLSRILGLVRDMVFARFFGDGMAADAFFVAFRIPNLLRRLFAEGSLTIAFIPVFTEYLTRKSRKDAFLLARAVLTLLSAVLVGITVLGILCSPWIVRIQAYGWGGAGAKYELTVLLTRIMFPYILLVSIVALFMGILNALRHFAAPAAAPILLNIGIIGATLWLSPHFSEPVVGVAVGVLIGGVLQLALQLPWILKKGVTLLPAWLPRHPAVRRIGLLMVPAVYGSAVYQLNQFIATLLATFLPEGSVSWLYYADRIVEFPLGVFAIAISTAVLPSLSRHAAGGDREGFGDTLEYAIRLVFFISVPSMAGLIVLGRPIIQVFFERGAFGPLSTDMTLTALFFYSMGLWAFSANRVMVSAFYALQDTKTPVKTATAAMAANFVFSLSLMGPLRHGGLALALSLASTLQFFLLLYLLKRKTPFFGLGVILKSGVKSLAASVLMGGVVYYLSVAWRDLDPPESLWDVALMLVVLVPVGALIYFSLAKLFRLRELQALKDILGPLLKRRP